MQIEVARGSCAPECRGEPFLLLRFRVDGFGFSERSGSDEIADAYTLLLRRLYDFLRLFGGIIGDDCPTTHDAHSATHNRLPVSHSKILAKCIRNTSA